jgi:hypothetical protein
MVRGNGSPSHKLKFIESVQKQQHQISQSLFSLEHAHRFFTLKVGGPIFSYVALYILLVRCTIRAILV